MYCKYCHSYINDGVSVCPICGSKLDDKEDIKFFEDDLSDGVELSDNEPETNDIDSTQIFSAGILSNTRKIELDDIEVDEKDDFSFDGNEFEFDDDAEEARKERAGVIEELFYGRDGEDDENDDVDLEYIKQSNKNKQMSIIAIAVAVGAILIIVLAILIVTNMDKKKDNIVEVTTAEEELTTVDETTRTHETYTVAASTTKAIETEEKTTKKKEKKTTQAPTPKPTQAPTQAPTERPTEAPTQAPTQAPTEPIAGETE